jgi:transketolase
MPDKISTREAYGRALEEYGIDENIVVLDADLTICTMTCYFNKKYPERFFNMGVAEANMIDVAAGFATTGKIALCHSFAMFTAGRGYDQIRQSIAYTGLNVKVVGSHAGLTVGEDGPTHQCIEDLSLMRTIPGMTVICPCDAHETKEAVKAMLAYNGPCYLRTGRDKLEGVTDNIPFYKFELGKGCLLREGNDVAIIATGIMVQESLKAIELLAKDGISARLIDMHTIKPLDKEIILKAARETGAIVTAEEHSIIGGLGSAVAEVIAENVLVPLERVGVEDVFGHSGKSKELLKKYGLTSEHVAECAKRVYNRK